MKFKLIIISLVLLFNIGFSFVFVLSTFYQSEDGDFSKFSTVQSLFSGDIKNRDIESIKIIEFLKQDKDIENKYIMSSVSTYSFYTNSKFIFTSFTEGVDSDTIEDFITKKNWSEFDHWFSNANSIPPHKNNSNQIPDYLIYRFLDTVIDPARSGFAESTIINLHSLLIDPTNHNLPDYVTPVYYSHFGNNGIVIYEVNFDY